MLCNSIKCTWVLHKNCLPILQFSGYHCNITICVVKASKYFYDVVFHLHWFLVLAVAVWFYRWDSVSCGIGRRYLSNLSVHNIVIKQTFAWKSSYLVKWVYVQFVQSVQSVQSVQLQCFMFIKLFLFQGSSLKFSKLLTVLVSF